VQTVTGVTKESVCAQYALGVIGVDDSRFSSIRDGSVIVESGHARWKQRLGASKLATASGDPEKFASASFTNLRVIEMFRLPHA
jgi:hypothetical protein